MKPNDKVSEPEKNVAPGNLVDRLVILCLSELKKKESADGDLESLAWMPSAREAQVREAMSAIAPHVKLA